VRERKGVEGGSDQGGEGKRREDAYDNLSLRKKWMEKRGPTPRRGGV